MTTLRDFSSLSVAQRRIVGGIQHLFHGDYVPYAGGVLVTNGEVILGAAGASGAHAREDEEAVRVAVERWRAQRPR
ncbi:heme-binding protein [Amycolatopsis mediterranei]|uniref:heme-binding protein n=1 Tax=Amycolatopsis mediterranei TaxID=33910 RepID=UPI00343AD79E